MDRQSLANKYTGNACTLDGKPAIIGGRLLDFAHIGHLDGPLSVQFAWTTVDRIMRSGGRFKS